MGVLERWADKLKHRQAVERAALKAYREARAARQAAERVIKRHKTSGAKRALAYAQSFVGTTESPPYSNRGPQIDKWERECNTLAQPWCGIFVHAALDAAGVKGLTSRMAYCPYIVDDARNGVGGLEKLVALKDLNPGDLLVYQFDSGPVDHVGFFVAWDKAGNLMTIEGNTSAGASGKQSDGGIVANRIRSKNTVAYCVRPRYPA